MHIWIGGVVCVLMSLTPPPSPTVQFEDPAKAVDMRVVKKKSFDMPPMSVQDAIVCLD